MWNTWTTKCLGRSTNIARSIRLTSNGAMLSIVLHVLKGVPIESFFPASIDPVLRNSLIIQSENLLAGLTSRGFMEDSGKTTGRIKRVAAVPPLRVLFIEATKECNLRCRHCYVADSGNPTEGTQLDIALLRDIVRQADDMSVMEVQLTGGEVFMVPGMVEVLYDLRDRLIRCSIFTNGTILPPTLMDLLRGVGGGMIFYISLDGAGLEANCESVSDPHSSERIHDEFRGVVGCFVKTVKSIRNLLTAGCDVRINTAVSRYNADHLIEFMAYVHSEFGVLHRLVPVQPIGRAKEREIVISDGRFNELLAAAGDEVRFLDSHDGLSQHDWRRPACGVGGSMMFVDAYGNASLCPTLTQEQSRSFLAGNIRISTIKHIWENSQAFHAFRGIQCKEIAACEYREACRGGCRSNAHLETGDLYAPDRQMCQFYDSAKQRKLLASFA